MAGRGPGGSRGNSRCSHSKLWHPLSPEVPIVSGWWASFQPFLYASPCVDSDTENCTCFSVCGFVHAVTYMESRSVFLQLAFHPWYSLEIMAQMCSQNHFVLFDVCSIPEHEHKFGYRLGCFNRDHAMAIRPSDRPSPVCLYLHFLNHVLISGSLDQSTRTGKLRQGHDPPAGSLRAGQNSGLLPSQYGTLPQALGVHGPSPGCPGQPTQGVLLEDWLSQPRLARHVSQISAGMESGH